MAAQKLGFFLLKIAVFITWDAKTGISQISSRVV